MRVFAILLVTALFGCANTSPTPLVVAPKEVVRVEVPVPVPCVDEIPAEPVLEKIPPSGLAEQMIARIKRENQLKEDNGKLRATLVKCKSPRKD